MTSMRAVFWSIVICGVFALSTPGVYATDDHLLLSEATVAPTSGEFLEIVNPTGNTIQLDNYYLSDDEDYALYP